MWTPTHVQVTIFKARNLIVKGKGGNNAFVTIAVGDEKFQTTPKHTPNGSEVIWNEQCELGVTDVDNQAVLVLTVRHLQPIGLYDFLGCVRIPLSTLDPYEKPRIRSYKLEGKPGKEKGKDKNRGELEVRIAFTVRASNLGSLMDIHKKSKHKTSLGNLSSKVGGSLLSLGSSEKRAGLKKVVKNIGKKMSPGKKREANGGDGASDKGSVENVNINLPATRPRDNADPGVISEDEDEFTLDNLSHKSSGSSLNVHNSEMLENLAGGEFLRRSVKGAPLKPPRAASPTTPGDEWEQKLCGKTDTLKRGVKSSPLTTVPAPRFDWSPLMSKKEAEEPQSLTPPVAKNAAAIIPTEASLPLPPPATKSITPSPKPAERRFMSSPNLQKQDSEELKEPTKFSKLKQQLGLQKEKKEERFIVGEEASGKGKEEFSRHSPAVIDRFQNMTRDDLIDIILNLEKHFDHSKHQIRDLEEYLDKLLLRVMENTPKILQNPYMSCKTEFKSH